MTVDGTEEVIAPAVRPLDVTFPDGEKAPTRRALVTFPYDFTSKSARTFRLTSRSAPSDARTDEALPVDISLSGNAVALKYADGAVVNAKILSPVIEGGSTSVEVVERNRYFLWERYHQRTAEWARTVELRADAFGTVVLVVHLMRLGGENSWLPELGWTVTAASDQSLPAGVRNYPLSAGAEGLSLAGGLRIYHPVAQHKGGGSLQLRNAPDGLSWTYVLGGSGPVPLQPYSWRKAEVVIAKSDQPRLTWTLQQPLDCALPYDRLSKLYPLGEKHVEGALAPVADALQLNRKALLQCMRLGADFGNVTLYDERLPAGDVRGWNRLNNCSPMFFEAWKTHDAALRDIAILWCENFHDLTIWWGPQGYGGTRYNTAPGMPGADFFWRSNSAVDFCTKGFAAFLLAYEETGDPRMLEAFTAQVNYAETEISAVRETRNVGAVRDLVDIWHYTGRQAARKAAMRIASQYLSKRSLGGLVSQSGKPITPNVPFIDDDGVGEKHAYPKPYMISYGLAGLSAYSDLNLWRRLHVRAALSDAADFIVRSQDPIGGWRYPHPKSSGIGLSLSVEIASQLMHADEALGTNTLRLDAIEAVLRQRIQAMQHCGRILDHIVGWELSAQLIDKQPEIYQLYKAPGDRDGARDYTSGGLLLGQSAPEGLIYLPEMLRYYTRHRPLSALLQKPGTGSPLDSVLRRLQAED